MNISIRCRQDRHSWSAMRSVGFKCEGHAWPGPLSADPVPCDCNCHKPGFTAEKLAENQSDDVI